MSITLGSTTLHYTTETVTDKTNYIVSYLPSSDVTVAFPIIKIIFRHLISLYSSTIDYLDRLKYSNYCSDNARIICNQFTERGIKSGILFIESWEPENTDVISTIESLYGATYESIGVAYHALAYVEATTVDGETFYIIIETNKRKPFSMQFYVGNSMQDVAQIIKARYQCKKFVITPHCNQSFNKSSTEDKIYGGKRKTNKRIKKRRKQITKRRKNNRRFRRKS